jgi:hypothetical protein
MMERSGQFVNTLREATVSASSGISEYSTKKAAEAALSIEENVNVTVGSISKHPNRVMLRREFERWERCVNR